MNIIIATLVALISVNSFAYTIQCEKDVSGPNPFQVTIEESDTYPELGLINATIKNEYNQGGSYSVFQTSRKNKLLFYSLSSKEEFTLDLGDFKGEGSYQNTSLGINTNTWFGRKLAIDCKVVGSIPFVNYCIETKKWNPETGLLQAARNRNFDLVEATLACGIDANIKDKNNCTPTLLASDPKCGSGFSNSPLPSLKNAKPILGVLIDSGAYLDELDPSTGESSFLKLVKFRDRDSAQFLLDLEADMNLQDTEGYTAIMRAVENSDYDMVLTLVSGGADISLKNKEGQTALEIAKVWGNKKIIELLAEPQTVITVEGKSDGSCYETEIHIPVSKVSRIILKATQNQMFKFEASDLSVEIVANPNSQNFKNILPKQTGEYKFTCGFHHGGGTPTVGKIIVH